MRERLQGQVQGATLKAVASIDLSDYSIVRDVPKILGILWQGIKFP